MATAFAEKLVGTAPDTLSSLIDACHEAYREQQDVLGEPWSPDLPDACQLAYEARCDAADDAFYLARQRLLDHFLSLGVTKARADKLAEVL